jgi:uncharacterized integral membrane protein
MMQSEVNSEVYRGQFGDFTITDRDRLGVMVYRGGLGLAAASFGLGTILVLTQLDRIENSNINILNIVTWLYGIFSVSLGISLATIHIYMVILHRALQVFWAIGCISSIALATQTTAPLVLTVYQSPLTLFGVGFTFVALTGIFFKEAFCFDRLETKFLTAIVPFLLLGHLTNLLPNRLEAILLAIWATLFAVFAVRKAIQAIPPDIGDKSVFEQISLSKQH